MRRWSAWALLCLLALSSLTAPLRAQDGVEDEMDDYEDEEEDSAHLVIRKTVKELLVREGANMTVSISVYNAGVR